MPTTVRTTSCTEYSSRSGAVSRSGSWAAMAWVKLRCSGRFSDSYVHARAEWLSRDATADAPYRIARLGIAYVPEGRGIFANLSVRENLIMAARPGEPGGRRWTLERVLATFPRLGERLAHGGGQLSGGEQQMLTIGRALLTNPDLLILDEATEGLAPRIAREIWSIVQQVRDSGIATVIVDKNFKAVNAVTDRNVILVKGSVAFEGSASDLLARPEIRVAFLGV